MVDRVRRGRAGESDEHGRASRRDGARSLGSLGSVSEQPSEPVPSPAGAMTIEELARAQGAAPVLDPHELAADIWESNEELDAFLADLRASRDAS